MKPWRREGQMTRFLLGSLNQAGPYFHATGEGLTTCALDETSGTITRLHVCADAENAIWITRMNDRLWVAGEHYLSPGGISAFSISDEGACSRIGRPQTSNGGAICHVAVTADGSTAFVSSYLGGISVHGIDVDGGVLPAHQNIFYEGCGPDTDRQEKSHPHQAVVSPDGKRLYVCDLGADMIWIHSIHGSELGPASGIPVVSGTGPRHLVFHPSLRCCYLLGELDARIHVFEANDGGLRQIATHDTLPDDFKGIPAGAAIKFHPSGKTLVVSNRNSDTITFFGVDPRGDLSNRACVASGGKTPRDFTISPSGCWLLAVNQDSHAVIPMQLNPDTGLPTGVRGASFACGSPVCATF
jgi:6-phosphogluconolactonase